MNGGNGGRGFGWGADNVWWVLILFLFAFNGNGGWGNNNNAVPYMQADVQRGFDQQATQTGINSLQAQIGNGFAQAAVSECQGNAAITAAVTGAQFATANAITNAKDTLANGMNGLAMALQNCCCENRASVADLKYTVATEACADRAAVSNGVRDLIASNTANTQAILDSQRQGFQSVQDKLC